MRIVERNTYERNKDIEKLFNKIKPLLDNGDSYNKAVKKVKNINSLNTNLGWYKELVEFGEKQGYLRNKYRSNRGRKKN